MNYVKLCLLGAAGTLGAAALALPATAATMAYSNQIVFGDSLVDAGNIFTLTGGATPNPSTGYFQGRFTNGPDFTDLINVPIEGGFTSPSLLGGDNYAFGGARIVNNSGFSAGGDPIPDLDFQVGTYLAAVGGNADPDALYTISAAGNDIFAIGRGETGPYTQEEYIALAATRLVANVAALDAAGARHILVMGVPNATTPVAADLESAILAGLATASLEAEIFSFDYFSFFGTLMTDPSVFGLPAQNLTDSCIDVRPVVNGDIDCTGIFSFDGTHFTAPIHRALAEEVSLLVGLTEEVPAPGALLLFGIGALALGIRRRAT